MDVKATRFYSSVGTRALGDTMANQNRRTKTALFLVLLMVLMPLASGTSLTTNFSSGSNEVEILLNDATSYSESVDGSIAVSYTHLTLPTILLV